MQVPAIEAERLVENRTLLLYRLIHCSCLETKLKRRLEGTGLGKAVRDLWKVS